MRIRMGCTGWLLAGWIVIPCYVLYGMFKGVVLVFLALMKALDKHNRRRAVRKAYERDRASKAAIRARQAAQQAYNGPGWIIWHDHDGTERRTWIGDRGSTPPGWIRQHRW